MTPTISRVVLAAALGLAHAPAHADEYRQTIRASTIAPGATYAGLLFHDAACKRRFGSHGTVAASARAAFAKCLLGHIGSWYSDTIGETTATSEFASSTDEVRIELTCPKRSALKPRCDGASATVKQVVGHDIAGAVAALKRAIPRREATANAEVRAEMERAGITKQDGIAHVCFDAMGKFRSVYVIDIKPLEAERQIFRLVPDQIAPYTIDGVSVPICGDIDVAIVP